ncbi:hypothetical protein B0H17DRAFT_1336696 [Mycena rosella]|uniref:Uncharacterized protein n=1 Tax=Mycena rosella TaxID=1033263 RepID=A0AAD7CUK1_MYCRO|nr:hypothetical protein B0H17DRAFT_1336696 [Mycena rosella]
MKLPVFVSYEYLDACDEVPPELTQKLLVLELHRILVFPERFVFGTFQTSPYLPRPYLSVFREYLLHPATRAWLHAVICTAEGRTVAERMVSEGTPLHIDDFHGIYTPVEMNPGKHLAHLRLSTTLTPKNLDVIWNTYKPAPSDVPPPPRHSPATTILLDRRERSGAQQPHSLLLFPEYEKPLRRHDLDRLHAAIGTQFSPKELVNKENRDREIARAHYTGYTRSVKKREGYEDGLIALIGVLQHLKAVPNVAAWLRDGGLMEAAGAKPDAAAWFDRPAVFDVWRKRGYAVVAELGLALEPGIVNDKEHMVKIARDALDLLESKPPPSLQPKKRGDKAVSRNKARKRQKERDQAIDMLRTLTGNTFLN